MADLVDRLGRVMGASPFHTRVGFVLEDTRPGFARVRLPYDDGNTTANQALHGGAIAATADLAGSLAAWSAGDADPKAITGRTLACDVSYVAGALGEDVFAEGEVLRRGREVVYSSVRVVNEAGKLLANANHVFQLRPRA